MEDLWQLPSVEEVAQRLSRATAAFPRKLVIAEIRSAVNQAREELRAGRDALDIDTVVLNNLSALERPSLRRVINATGVILHTNLGRAPLAAFESPHGFSNLEYNLETGKRGNRGVHLRSLIEKLLGKPGITVNNNAAAVYLVLHELAAGAEVVVSRGQLIEIGDGFRIPDIMQRAGVVLREVGTTNRTRIEDYATAITERTRLLLIVHPSNFRIQGFTAQPTREEMVALGREHGIPVYEDLGSGCVVDLRPYGIHEPIVQAALAAGVNLVSFSGDKLLGGPQAGIIAGDAQLVERVRRNPMFRAFRVDKLILASLETTLRHALLERWEAIPALQMIRLTKEELRMRAEAILANLPQLNAQIVAGESVIGGGSTPEQSLPTWHISIEAPHWEPLLRNANPPVIAMVKDNRLLLDLRTVLAQEDEELTVSLRLLAADSQQ